MGKYQVDRVKSIRTTIALPEWLMEKSQRFINAGFAANRTALITAALESFLAELEEREIDRQFAALADDDESRQLYDDMTNAFDPTDWEAFQLGEDEA